MDQFVLFDIKMAELTHADSCVLGTDAWQRKRFSGHQALHKCKTGSARANQKS